MYPYLFGIETLKMYDLIGVFGYVLVIGFFLSKKNRPLTPIEQEKGALHAWLWVSLPLAVHLIAFTFGGERLGSYIGRGTEFFGYLLISAVGMVLAAVTLGAPPLAWLDKTVPLYLSLAAMLKLSCFCAGCCYGVPWVHGLYNARLDQTQFPIQLVEAAVYAALFFLLRWYKRQSGQRFALFLVGYATVRFAVQFFRADVAVFTLFHWMSAMFAVVGVVMWVVCAVRKNECFT